MTKEIWIRRVYLSGTFDEIIEELNGYKKEFEGQNVQVVVDRDGELWLRDEDEFDKAEAKEISRRKKERKEQELNLLEELKSKYEDK